MTTPKTRKGEDQALGLGAGSAWQFECDGTHVRIRRAVGNLKGWLEMLYLFEELRSREAQTGHAVNPLGLVQLLLVGELQR